MSFSQESGYLPIPIETMMLAIMENINTLFGTSYTEDVFVGTNFYKTFYALMQRVQENEIKTSEIFLKLQEYFEITNELVARPNTTAPGIIDFFAAAGYEVSVQAPEDSDPGEVSICANVDNGDPNYAAIIKPAICEMIKNCIVAGVVSQGTETESITLSNGQSFDFKFSLPDPTPILVRVTITISENNEFTIAADAVVTQTLFDNINAKYKLGKNFEPETYLSITDIPWAGTYIVEYSTDGGSMWTDDVATLDFDEIFTFALDDVTVVYT